MKATLFLATLLLSGYGMAGSINVAVAANVSDAINVLKQEFNILYPDTEVKVTLGSSGKLTAQIKNAAPYQLFMSADMSYPVALYEEGIAVTRPLVYAQGGLAYLSNKKQDLMRGMELLKSNTVTKIAIANPKTAPYGKAAVEAMKNAGVYDDVKEKLVFAESISQTVAYAVTAADIGLIARSSLHSPKMLQFKEGVNWTEVNSTLYTPINQGVVILKEGTNSDEVKAFYNFILSKKAQKILRDFGYLIP